MQIQQDELIRVTIKALMASREGLKIRLDEIDKAIAYQESILNRDVGNIGTKNLVNNYPPQVSNSNTKVSYTPSIGTKATKDTILDIFNEANRPLKITEIQDLYHTKTNSKSSIKEFLRKMLKRKELRIMKINNSNRNSLWIKPDWMEGNKLKQEYKDLIYLIYSIDELTFV